LGPHPAIVASSRSIWDRLGLAEVPIGLLLLMLAALLVRAIGLPAVQGTMGRDEARLALAARGILQHGLPILPGGFLYTRGLLPAYVDAASFAVFGPTDQAARLPDLIVSTLLVAATYRLGRLVGGPRPALAAAAIVAFSPPLVLQAREAWLYSIFVLWMALALGWLVRDGPGDRPRAAVATIAALFSHELAVLILPVAALLDLVRARQARRQRLRGVSPARRWPASWWPVLLFWTVALVGTVAVAVLSLTLRAPTAGGATIEFREYLQPSVDPRGLGVSLAILGGWHPWLLPAAIVGLPLSRSSWRALLAGRGVLAYVLMVLAVVCFNGFGLVRRGESRYMLAAIPFLAIVAAVSLDRLGPSIVAALAGRRRLGHARHITRFALLTVLVAATFDPVRLVADAQTRAVTTTWVRALDDRAPSDLIVSFAPTLTSHYLGRTDFWVRTEGYDKYVWAGGTPLRDVHTGAVVIRDAAELQRLLLEPYRGRTAWVLLAGEPAAETSRLMRELNQQLVAMAVEVRRSDDGRLVLQLQL
jgi:4-amino-4-deoxy-L-arabinose transferase-like glycosyltransferase